MPNSWISRSVWSRCPRAEKREQPAAEVSSATTSAQVSSRLSSSFVRSVVRLQEVVRGDVAVRAERPRVVDLPRPDPLILPVVGDERRHVGGCLPQQGEPRGDRLLSARAVLPGWAVATCPSIPAFWGHGGDDPILDRSRSCTRHPRQPAARADGCARPVCVHRSRSRRLHSHRLPGRLWRGHGRRHRGRGRSGGAAGHRAAGDRQPDGVVALDTRLTVVDQGTARWTCAGTCSGWSMVARPGPRPTSPSTCRSSRASWGAARLRRSLHRPRIHRLRLPGAHAGHLRAGTESDRSRGG